MNAYCFSLALSEASEIFLSSHISDQCIISPAEYNCCYHTSILQFYSNLTYSEILYKLSLNILHFDQYTNLVNTWDKKIKEIGSIYSNIYSEKYSSIGLSYKNNDIIHQIGNLILNYLVVQDYIAGSDKEIDEDEHNTARFKFVQSYPERIKNCKTTPHTTLGFYPCTSTINNQLSPDSGNLDEKNYFDSISHDRLIFSKLNHLCMTPRDSFTLVRF